MIVWSAVTLACLFVSANTHSLFRRPNNSVVTTFTERQTEPAISSEEQIIINSILELAFDVSSSQWKQRIDGNVVQSPISIASLLNLLLLGSRGLSHTQLKAALHYPPNMTDVSIHQSFKKILESIETSGAGVEVSTSSRLFLKEGFSINEQFNNIAEDSYKSQVRGLNFDGAPALTMNRINKWVARATRGKITDLITRPFPPSTKFVAANVIYFNGEWENPFSERLTSNGFFNTGVKNISIPMMTTLMKVPFFKGDLIGFNMIALPYKGGKYSMYILTPTSNSGIQSLLRMEHVLNSYIIDDIISRMKTQRVAVKMPRMKLSHKMNMKKDLQNLGVTEIFDPQLANFGRLTTQTGIFVDEIVHEAIIEITETGTVAAAATAGTFDRIGGHEIFHLDRPSLLLIRENVSNLTLFWARVTEPEPIF